MGVRPHCSGGVVALPRRAYELVVEPVYRMTMSVLAVPRIGCIVASLSGSWRLFAVRLLTEESPSPKSDLSVSIKNRLSDATSYGWIGIE